MDMKKFQSNANTFFSRAFQKTEEVLKTAEKTSLDANLDESIKQVEICYKWAHGLISLIDNVVQPNPAMRMEDMVLKGFDRKKERPTAAEQLGESMIRIGQELGGASAHANILSKCGNAQMSIGQAERVLMQDINDSYSDWLRYFVNNTYKEAQEQKDRLETCRLDLDRAKTVAKRAGNDAAKHSRADMQMRDAEQVFRRQCEVTQAAMEECLKKFDEHKHAVQKILNAQVQYYQQCLDAVNNASRQ